MTNNTPVDELRFEVYTTSTPRGWETLELPRHLSVVTLQQARATFRFLVKDYSMQLGFTPNDWAKRALEEAGCPKQYLTGFDLFALVHAVKCFKVRINGKIFNEPYPVLGSGQDKCQHGFSFTSSCQACQREIVGA